MNTVTLNLQTLEIRHRKGLGWVVSLPGNIASGDCAFEPEQSSLQLYEDGLPLGPAHAIHDRISLHGKGLFSHWQSELYFSTSDGSDPRTNNRSYTVSANARAEEIDEPIPTSAALFPMLERMADAIHKLKHETSVGLLHNPDGHVESRVRMLEAKVEYLLDELYNAKAQLRFLRPMSEVLTKLQAYQINTFNFQWQNLPYHDSFLSNPAWRDKAAADICQRLEVDEDWIRRKKVLDCGCGPGRHAWAFSSMGAKVTAFDTSDSGLNEARQHCAEYPDTIIEKRNILETLPYPDDFDIVWSYGVIHCTGDTYRALSNIARHVKPGGIIYFMVYAEPERSSQDSYAYYHQVYVLRQLSRQLDFHQKAKLCDKIQGQRFALSWFDAISSEINDLYTIEELADLLRYLGFEQVRRTMLHEGMLNVVATKSGGTGAS